MTHVHGPFQMFSLALRPAGQAITTMTPNFNQKGTSGSDNGKRITHANGPFQIFRLAPRPAGQTRITMQPTLHQRGARASEPKQDDPCA